MTKRTRYFILGSVALLVVGLSIGLVAYYGGLPPNPFKSGGPDELAYVPKDAAVVAYADVRQVMTSEFRQRMRQLEPQKQTGQKEFRDQTGIDIENDIDRVVAWVAPDRGPDSTSKGAMVLARGRFNESRIEALVREHGGTVEQYKGKHLLLVKGLGHEDEMSPSPARQVPELAVAFIEPDVAAFGATRSIREAIDARQTGQDIRENKELMRLIEAVDAGTAWAVGRFDTLASQAHLPEQVASQMPPISWFSASGRIDGGVSGRVSVEARDAEAAKNLRDVVNGFVALARMQAGSKTEMQGVLHSLAILPAGSAEDKTVAISFSVPAKALDALTPKAPKGTLK